MGEVAWLREEKNSTEKKLTLTHESTYLVGRDQPKSAPNSLDGGRLYENVAETLPKDASNSSEVARLYENIAETLPKGAPNSTDDVRLYENVAETLALENTKLIGMK